MKKLFVLVLIMTSFSVFAGTVICNFENTNYREIETCILGDIRAKQSRNVYSDVSIKTCVVENKRFDIYISLEKVSENEIRVAGSVNGAYHYSLLTKEVKTPWQLGINRLELSDEISVGCGQGYTSLYFRKLK